MFCYWGGYVDLGQQVEGPFAEVTGFSAPRHCMLIVDISNDNESSSAVCYHPSHS